MTDFAAVHEISGVVPGETITGLLRVLGVDPDSGTDPSLASGGFAAVRSAVKSINREGWSAGQVLEQVSWTLFWLVNVLLTIYAATRRSDSYSRHTNNSEG